jgi:hypothetical protein
MTIPTVAAIVANSDALKAGWARLAERRAARDAADRVARERAPRDVSYFERHSRAAWWVARKRAISRRHNAKRAEGSV